jgi:hypothetical protein
MPEEKPRKKTTMAQIVNAILQLIATVDAKIYWGVVAIYLAFGTTVLYFSGEMGTAEDLLSCIMAEVLLGLIFYGIRTMAINGYGICKVPPKPTGEPTTDDPGHG